MQGCAHSGRYTDHHSHKIATTSTHADSTQDKALHCSTLGLATITILNLGSSLHTTQLLFLCAHYSHD